MLQDQEKVGIACLFILFYCNWRRFVKLSSTCWRDGKWRWLRSVSKATWSIYFEKAYG